MTQSRRRGAPDNPAPDRPAPDRPAPDNPAPDNPAPEAGMTTAEYAVGTIAACGFAGVLFEIVRSPAVQRLILAALQRAFSVLAW